MLHLEIRKTSLCPWHWVCDFLFISTKVWCPCRRAQGCSPGQHVHGRSLQYPEASEYSLIPPDPVQLWELWHQGEIYVFYVFANTAIFSQFRMAGHQSSVVATQAGPGLQTKGPACRGISTLVSFTNWMDLGFLIRTSWHYCCVFSHVCFLCLLSRWRWWMTSTLSHTR